MVYREGSNTLLIPLEERLRQAEQALKDVTTERDTLLRETRERATFLRTARWRWWQRRLGFVVGGLAIETAVFMICCRMIASAYPATPFTWHHPLLALWFGLANVAAGAIYLMIKADD